MNRVHYGPKTQPLSQAASLQDRSSHLLMPMCVPVCLMTFDLPHVTWDPRAQDTPQQSPSNLFSNTIFIEQVDVKDRITSKTLYNSDSDFMKSNSDKTETQSLKLKVPSLAAFQKAPLKQCSKK